MKPQLFCHHHQQTTRNVQKPHGYVKDHPKTYIPLVTLVSFPCIHFKIESGNDTKKLVFFPKKGLQLFPVRAIIPAQIYSNTLKQNQFSIYDVKKVKFHTELPRPHFPM